MSRHHIAIKHNRYARRIRPVLEAMLPMPCPHCRRPVERGTAWDVAHIVAAENGGRTELGNVVPAHRRCNRSDGGRRGAARRHRIKQTHNGIREW